MKADLAIYSLVVGMSGQWVNVATINWISTVVTIQSVFANPVTYYELLILITIVVKQTLKL